MLILLQSLVFSVVIFVIAAFIWSVLEFIYKKLRK